jgi:K+ transporter
LHRIAYNLIGSFTGAVVVVAIVILVALFSIQRFGTGKVGFMFAPALALWFFSLGSIGIYNLVKYDISVLRAFNPAYIYFFFKKNSTDAWSALGGCVLCITGTSHLQTLQVNWTHFIDIYANWPRCSDPPKRDKILLTVVFEIS